MKTILCNNGSIKSYVIKQLVPWGFGLELIHSSPWLVEQGDEIDAVFLLRLQNWGLMLQQCGSVYSDVP